jgi:hypothetical protein
VRAGVRFASSTHTRGLVPASDVNWLVATPQDLADPAPGPCSPHRRRRRLEARRPWRMIRKRTLPEVDVLWHVTQPLTPTYRAIVHVFADAERDTFTLELAESEVLEALRTGA